MLDVRFKNLVTSYSLSPHILWRNIRWRLPQSASKEKHIFIVGAPRSGTTLLQVMLSQHSNLFSYQRESEVFSYRNIFDPTRIWFGLPAELIQKLYKECKDVVEFFDASINLLGVGAANQRFVEKTPQHVLHLPFIFKWFPNSQIIHIVRDGRDCYCSSKINIDIPQNKSVTSFAKYWKKCVSEAIHFEYMKNLYTIKYEDLVCSPKAQLAAVMQFLELNLEGAQLDSTQYAKDIRAKRIEFQKLGSEINSSSIERWKKELTDEQAIKFEQITATELQHYGYK